MKLYLVLSLLIIALLIPQSVQARRTTPDDLAREALQAYENTLKTYTPTHQQNLKDMTTKIADTNRSLSAQLTAAMETQAVILDEYQTRLGKGNLQESFHSPQDGKNSTDPLDQARYWVTYAHEAVAWQAAKQYTITLTGEKNIKSDALQTIGALRADLASTRQKVLNSQALLQKVVK